MSMFKSKSSEQSEVVLGPAEMKAKAKFLFQRAVSSRSMAAHSRESAEKYEREAAELEEAAELLQRAAERSELHDLEKMAR